MIIVFIKISFLCWDETFPGLHLLFFMWLTAKRGSLSFLKLPFKYLNTMQNTPSLFFFKEIRPNSITLSSQRYSLAHCSSWWPSFGLSLVCPHHPLNWNTTGHNTPDAAWKALSRWRWLHVYQCWQCTSENAAQDSICLCCCSRTVLTYEQFLSTKTPRCLTARLLSSHTDPSLHWPLLLFCSDPGAEVHSQPLPVIMDISWTSTLCKYYSQWVCNSVSHFS